MKQPINSGRTCATSATVTPNALTVVRGEISRRSCVFLSGSCFRNLLHKISRRFDRSRHFEVLQDWPCPLRRRRRGDGKCSNAVVAQHVAFCYSRHIIEVLRAMYGAITCKACGWPSSTRTISCSRPALNQPASLTQQPLLSARTTRSLPARVSCFAPRWRGERRFSSSSSSSSQAHLRVWSAPSAMTHGEVLATVACLEGPYVDVSHVSRS